MVTLVVILGAIGIFAYVIFGFGKKKAQNVKEKLTSEGFVVDKFFSDGAGFLALSLEAKRVAMGDVRRKDIGYCQYSDIVKFNIGSDNGGAFVYVVTRNVDHPSYKLYFNFGKAAQECHDTLLAVMA